MNPDNCALAAGLVSLSYIRQGEQALARRQRLIKALLSSRRLPERGWDEATIEMLIRDCSAMDSNNFLDNVGVGEREGRVACPLVARRHYGLAHGIGRSGDIAAEQPKAAGSSLMATLTAHLAADALRIAGLTGVGPVSVLPLATGMALTLVLLALRPQRPAGADTVVWSRVDQKTCLKAITAAGLRPHVVELRRQGDELVTDVQGISEALAALDSNRIVAVVTTTSCFAPRAPDDVAAVARLCAAADVPHVVNNAYGVQSRQTCRAVAAAWSRSGCGGRVDAVVQSTDKNFMVPVGGALVAAPATRPGLVAAVNGTYPGRASVAAHLDLLMTLLHWGAEGWRKVLAEREDVMPYLRDKLRQLAARQSERVLETPSNPISMALTLDTLVAATTVTAAAAAVTEVPAAAAAPGETGTVEAAAEAKEEQEEQAAPSGNDDLRLTVSRMVAAEGHNAQSEAHGPGKPHEKLRGAAEGQKAVAARQPPPPPVRRTPDVTFFGAMLWSRCVSGTRVVAPGKTQTVGGVTFHNYGSHTEVPYPSTYMTAAAALGTTRADVDELIVRLDRCFTEFRKKCGAATTTTTTTTAAAAGENGGRGMAAAVAVRISTEVTQDRGGAADADVATDVIDGGEVKSSDDDVEPVAALSRVECS
ncbi:hypothetical protein Vretimale_5501 [Volvox reticuliferus]|uniref:O-phosphoseryl-tRNA(Sec) selenium transferase n=1 Tax=Volvox reticuliferus TaxID=1737510 RepID=A0A8J4FJQ7_9CHLO|nr:hypothetical protein Vretifemale_3777 [Volvox reticuliferus]GIM00359.1 hypothetical protein Vretimale_5501 [Volvox reticuliferus]